MPRPITAHYSGICGRCSKPFPKGAQISYSTVGGATRRYYHYPECPTENGVTPEVAAVVEETAASVNAGATEPMAVLAQAMAPYLDEMISAKVDPEMLKAEIQDAVNKLAVPVQIEVKQGDVKIKVEGVQHKNFKRLLKRVTSGKHIYLYGGPGWGKSTAAAKVAEALNREFGYISLTMQTSDSRLIGYKDANGTYHPTLFRKLYENGGVFCIDEADNANGNTLTALNSTLANGQGAFPDGMVKMHPEFICIATGNTVGTGASAGFQDRRPLDAAFRDRFIFIEWEEDAKLERTIALGYNNNATRWIEWVQKVRAYVKTNQIRLVVSPRATYTGAELLRDESESVANVADEVLFKGLDADTVRRIVTANPFPEVR